MITEKDFIVKLQEITSNTNITAKKWISFLEEIEKLNSIELYNEIIYTWVGNKNIEFKKWLVKCMEINDFNFNLEMGTWKEGVDLLLIHIILRKNQNHHEKLVCIEQIKWLFNYYDSIDLLYKYDQIFGFLIEHYEQLILELNIFSNEKNLIMKFLNRSKENQAYNVNGIILNILVSNYISRKMGYDALKLIENSIFKSESTFQKGRFYYHMGMISSIKCNYNEALKYFEDALKLIGGNPSDLTIKTQKNILLSKLFIGKQLGMLVESIEKKSEFEGYLKIWEVVKNGDLKGFENNLKIYRNIFMKDDTILSVRRQTYSVYREIILKISKVFSKISLDHICCFLGGIDMNSAMNLLKLFEEKKLIEFKISEDSQEISFFKLGKKKSDLLENGILLNQISNFLDLGLNSLQGFAENKALGNIIKAEKTKNG